MFRRLDLEILLLSIQITQIEKEEQVLVSSLPLSFACALTRVNRFGPRKVLINVAAWTIGALTIGDQVQEE